MKTKVKIRTSLLKQLADNNSFSEELIKKEFPQLFENKLEVRKWYKSTYINQNGVKSLFLAYIEDLENQLNYGFDFKGEFETNMYFANDSNSLVLATPQEVETALIQEAKKIGYKEGIYIDCFGIDDKLIKGGNFELLTNENNLAKVAECVLWFGKGENGTDIFRDGQWATIIETPTDIITIVEKYGKDKVISLIEKM